MSYHDHQCFHESTYSDKYGQSHCPANLALPVRQIIVSSWICCLRFIFLRLLSYYCVQQVFKIPHVLGDVRDYCRSGAPTAVDAYEIVMAKCRFYGPHIGPQAIARQLAAWCQPFCQTMHESLRCDQLAILPIGWLGSWGKNSHVRPPVPYNPLFSHS